MRKLVTAIITTHNRQELLKRAVESVFLQTYPNIELIVVDDASTDGTDEYCSVLPLQYIHISKQESKGGNYACNLGIKIAKGEYIAFLDDDDYWLPTKIEKQVALIENKDCELVYCGRIFENVDNKRNSITYETFLPDRKWSGDLSQLILTQICTTTSAILVKKDALIDVGLFDECLCFWQEYDLTIRLAQRKPFYFCDEPLLVYRNCSSGRLSNNYDAWLEAVSYVYNKYADLYCQLNPVQRLKVRLYFWRDAAGRCRAAGLSGRYLMYRLLMLPFTSPSSVFRKIKRILLK